MADRGAKDGARGRSWQDSSRVTDAPRGRLDRSVQGLLLNSERLVSQCDELRELAREREDDELLRRGTHMAEQAQQLSTRLARLANDVAAALADGPRSAIASVKVPTQEVTSVGLGATDAPTEPLPGNVAPAGEPGAPGKLLVVDDSGLNRLVMAQELGEHGYAVEVASSGHEALELVAQRRFDLVLLDVMMPGISGLEVLQKLRESYARADLPVIMVTGRDASEDVVEALQAGANDYVTKPLDFAVGAARIETQLALRRAKGKVEALNQRLVHAQERITQLAESAAESMHDVAAWSTSMATQIAEAIGADAVEVSVFDDEDHAPPSRMGLMTIDEDMRQVALTGKRIVRAGHTIVPVRGPSKKLFGALAVVGKGAGWTGQDRHLVDSFAHQLGGALELRRMRSQLSDAAEKRRVRQRELLDQGVDLLRVCPKCGRCYDQKSDRCEKDRTTLPQPRSFPYRVSDRYRLVRVCGEGGMGTVYRGFDERLDRQVALKVIRAEHFHNDTVRKRFDYEARAVARIDHPGVVAVFDSGELLEGSLFIVMEWLDGRDLAYVLAKCGPGTPREVAALVRLAGDALAAAGEAGLVHRDIKPGNIFLVPDEQGGFRVKLVDFGVAKEVTADAGLTQTGAVVGTPRYMSPEQLLQKKVDARSDLYSLAAVVYLALTGRRVVESEEFGEVVLDVVQTMPPAVSSLLDGASQELDAAFATALAKAAEERPDCVRSWANSVAALLERLPSPCSSWLDGSGQFVL